MSVPDIQVDNPSVSVFKSVEANTPAGTQTLEKIVNVIHTGKTGDWDLKPIFSDIRKAPDKTTRKAIKKGLPMFTLSFPSSFWFSRL